MNQRELKEMNSIVRKFILKYNDFKTFRRQLDRHHIDITNKTILEVGCGCGYGLQLISKKLRPAELVAFDYMESQVKRAKELINKKGIEAKVSTGDVTNMEFPAQKFDAVFVFAVLHHVPEWRYGLKEIHRVLKSGGVLLIEEPNKEVLDSVDHLYEHPEEAKFMWGEFIEALKAAGFSVLEDKRMYKNGNVACMMCRKE